MLQTFIDTYGDAAFKIALFTFAGFTIDFIVYRIWLARAKTTKHEFAGAVARLVHWLPTLAALLIAIRLTVPGLELTPSVVKFISTASQVTAILVVTAKLALFAGRLVHVVTARVDTPLPSSSLFVNLARGLVWAIGALVLLGAMNVSLAPLVTALGVGGLAVGLALQPTLENLFGGIQVLMSRQVQIGDYIRLETAEEGYVRDVTWRNTTVQMLSNDLVIVPNAVIARSRVMNFTSLDEQHSVTVPVRVAYGSDLDHVERVTCAAATAAQNELEGAVPDWEPPIRFYDFGDSGIGLRVILRVERYDARFAVLSEFIKRLHVAYAEAGIEIPFPQLQAHLISTTAE